MITASESHQQEQVRVSATADGLLAEARSRMAADVHDLIMQDLSFALASARTLVDDPAMAPRARPVVAAAERALAGAREVMSGLAGDSRKPVIEAVEASVRTAARSTPLEFDAAGVPAHEQPDRPTLEALVHISREAVTNAVKHGDPTAIEVILAYTDEWLLRVCDQGRGFDEAAGSVGGGFGLGSMARHAHALGGFLLVTSARGEGTTVEARLP
jgi:signal transduction histidine kinase